MAEATVIGVILAGLCVIGLAVIGIRHRRARKRDRAIPGVPDDGAGMLTAREQDEWYHLIAVYRTVQEPGRRQP
jgi:hypothetical protein